MTEYQEQVKNNIMYPNVSRNRNPSSEFNGIPSKAIASILKEGGPRLQFQFNDINNKCIGDSWVLKAENPIIESSDLIQLKYIPITKDMKSLVVPDNAVSIGIFGQQGRFASIESALNKLTDRLKFNSEYVPTCGIEVSDYFYMRTPMKFIQGVYSLKDANPLLLGYHDIIDCIEFEDGRFKSLTTIESLFKVDSFNHSI